MPLPDPMVISEKRYPDEGISEFTFRWNGKEYKVESGDGNGDIVNAFYKYVRMGEKGSKKGLNPFTYKHLDKLLINGENPRKRGPKKPPSPEPPKPEAIQTDLFEKLAYKLDSIASVIESKGFITEAEKIDVIANTIEALKVQPAKPSRWCGIESILFWDEIANQDIGYDNAKKILDAYNDGADTEHSCAEVTNIDAWTCKKVLDIAYEKGILDIINNSFGDYNEWIKQYGPDKAQDELKEIYEKLQEKESGSVYPGRLPVQYIGMFDIEDVKKMLEHLQKMTDYD